MKEDEYITKESVDGVFIVRQVGAPNIESQEIYVWVSSPSGEYLHVSFGKMAPRQWIPSNKYEIMEALSRTKG